MSKHTPGPWGVRHEFHRIYVAPIRQLGGINQVLRHPRIAVYREPKSGAKRGQSPTWYGFDEETIANARLIAAAPELLEEVRLAMNRIAYHIEVEELTLEEWDSLRGTLRDAIAKATAEAA